MKELFPAFYQNGFYFKPSGYLFMNGSLPGEGKKNRLKIEIALRFFLYFTLLPFLFRAQDTVKVALNLTPEQQAEVDYNNGVEAIKKADYNSAVELFTKSIVAKPTLHNAFANRAIAYAYLKKTTEAILDVNAAIKLSPQNAGYYFDKSLIYFSINNKDSQDVALNKCLAINAIHPEAAYYKGLICYEKKEFDKAIGFYGVAIQNKQDYTFAYNDRASARRAKGDFEGAVLDYEKAIKLDSSQIFIYNNLGSACRENKNYVKAIDAYSKAFKANPKYLLALINRGCTYFDMGNYKAAQTDFEEALFVDPSNSFAYNNLCSIALKNKEYKKAKDLATRAIELDPKNGPAFYNRGIASQMLREEDACCADWRKSYALGVEGAKLFINAACKE